MLKLTRSVPLHARKLIAPLTMSDKAVEEMTLILHGHGLSHFACPAKFGPVVAKTVVQFINSFHFQRSAWFRAQLIHKTKTLQFTLPSGELVNPDFHLLRNPLGGYAVLSPDEVPIPSSYLEERLIAEVGAEAGS